MTKLSFKKVGLFWGDNLLVFNYLCGSYPHEFLCRTDCSACADYQPCYSHHQVFIISVLSFQHFILTAFLNQLSNFGKIKNLWKQSTIWHSIPNQDFYLWSTIVPLSPKLPVLVEESSRRRFARYVHVINWNLLFYCSNIAKSENAMLWRMLSRLETCIESEFIPDYI
jgi:hypothetical protein